MVTSFARLTSAILLLSASHPVLAQSTQETSSPNAGQTRPTADAGSPAEPQVPSVGTTGSAGAQPDAPVQEGIGDIIVTAERREQSVQRSPLTIQVIGSEEVAKSGLSNAEDLTRLVAGVQIGNGGGQSQIFVRGVGDFSYTVLASPGVAFNADGVYIGRPNGVNGNFYDVARVEVLKGPQGTLYGRNANGGSINLITNDPRLGVLGGYVSGEVGNYDLLSTTGAINLPLGDRLAARVAFRVIDRDGYLSDGTNDDVQQAVRLKLLFEATPDVTLRLNADYSHLGGEGGGYTYIPRRPGSGRWEGTNGALQEAYKDSYQALSFPSLPSPFDPARQFQDTELWNVSAQLDADLGFASLTVLPAYRGYDINSTVNTGYAYESRAKGDQKSLEVRLGNSSPGLTWVVGGFYFDEDIEGFNGVNLTEIIQNAAITFRPNTKAYAAFGQATVGITDRFRGIVGARYTYERRVLDGIYGDARTFYLDPPPPPTVQFLFGGRVNFDAFTYKIGAEYDLAERSLLYATFSTGFKAGGLNQTAVPGRIVYQPEKLDAFEAGVKNRFFDNRLQINGSAFYWKYRDIQNQNVEVLSPTETNFLFSNVGDATIYGATLDLIAKPTENDTLSASIEFTKSEYDRFVAFTAFYDARQNGCPVTEVREVNGVPNTFVDCKGFQVARTPKWSGSASYQRNIDLAGNGALQFLGSLQFSSARWIATDFIPNERDGAYAIFNASVDYTSENDRFTIGAFIRNIGKTSFYTGGIQRPFLPTLIAANINEPRVYGLRASVKFGEQ